MLQSAKVLQALSTIIENAKPELQEALSEALEEFAFKAGRSYRELSRGQSFGARTLRAVEYSSGAMIARDSVGIPSRTATDFTFRG